MAALAIETIGHCVGAVHLPDIQASAVSVVCDRHSSKQTQKVQQTRAHRSHLSQ
jgi:hypothetical protein